MKAEWTKEEIEALYWCKSMGYPTEDISVFLKRSVKGIRTKWLKLTKPGWQEREIERDRRRRLREKDRRLESEMLRAEMEDEGRLEDLKAANTRFQEAFLLAHPNRRYESIATTRDIPWKEQRTSLSR